METQTNQLNVFDVTTGKYEAHEASVDAYGETVLTSASGHFVKVPSGHDVSGFVSAHNQMNDPETKPQPPKPEYVTDQSAAGSVLTREQADAVDGVDASFTN